MRFNPLALLAVLVLALAFASPALAADEKSIIGGTVYFDRNRDGSPENDPGLRGVQVALTGPRVTRRAVTDGKGGFSFDGLAAGDYTISALPPDGHQLTTPLNRTVRMDGKNANRNLDFGVAIILASPTPTASPTPRATVTPTPTSTATAINGALPVPLVQRPAAGSPQPVGDTQAAVQAALELRARAAGSPAPIIIQTVTPTPTATPEGGRGGAPDGTARLRAASLEPLRYAAGRDRLAAVKRWENAETVWLGVPFRTQMDATYYAQVNCGPASLAMAMGAFGINLDPHAIREYVNFLSGNLDPDSGTSLDHLARVAREAGIRTLDLYSARGYRAWDLDLVRQHVAQGHPVITLTRYQSLPGNANSRFQTDHYVVITGLSGDDFIYNDPAYGSNAGYGLLISGPDLERAWVFSSIPGHSVALALDGDTQVPDWVRRRVEARASTVAALPEPAAEEPAAVEAMTSIGQVPGDQELPMVHPDVVAMALLDILAAPRQGERAFVAPLDFTPTSADDEPVAAMVIPPPAEPTKTVRLAEVFIFDPVLVTLFLSLLGIFLPPALRRNRR